MTAKAFSLNKFNIFRYFRIKNFLTSLLELWSKILIINNLLFIRKNIFRCPDTRTKELTARGSKLKLEIFEWKSDSNMPVMDANKTVPCIDQFKLLQVPFSILGLIITFLFQRLTVWTSFQILLNILEVWSA